MFDRSSSQPPPDSGHVPPFAPFSHADPNDPNEQGFYRENAHFYPNHHQNHHQNYHQNVSRSSGEYQDAPYQSGPNHSLYFPQYSYPQNQNQHSLHQNQHSLHQNQHSLHQNQHSLHQNQHSLHQNQHDLPQNHHDLPQNQHSLHQNQHDLPQNHHDLPQNHHDLPQNHHDLPQNHHDLPQNHHDLHQNHHDLPQNHHDLHQNLHDLPQNRHDLPQNLHDLDRNLHDLDRNLHDLDQDQQQDVEYSVYDNYQRHEEFYPSVQPRFNPQQVKREYEEDEPSATPEKKKRGRPSKKTLDSADASDEKETQRKKRNLNRFDGLSAEEVMSRTLPDVIEEKLDILIIGINPGLLSAFKGHHYPSPGNHFWKCLFLSGFTEKQLNYLDDVSLPQKYSIGFTNIVERTTPGSKDLSSKEIREGGKRLLEKLQKYKPLIAAFNGKGIYEIFCKETFGVKAKNLEFGLQPYKIPETETVCFLMPSSSPRCAQFPRAQDKVHFYIKLKELRDGLKGAGQRGEVEETRYTFDLQLAKEDAKRLSIKEEQEDPEYENCAGVSSETNTEAKPEPQDG
ncbi:uncharacterized protein [Eucyclogobius newberryi]|uniref:uncharacterized protein n=1 Tax=Eucyclogobius newberryi TaxID=166745 RepID=UPI003B5BBE1F